MSAAIKPKSPDQQFDSLISWSMMMQAFLARKIHSFRTGNTVAVSFDSELEAEEFYRLMLKRNPDSRAHSPAINPKTKENLSSALGVKLASEGESECGE